MIGRCVKHTERCVLKNLLEFSLLSRSLAWIYASINQNCKIPRQMRGRRGTRTPSLVRERIYSPCGYQLPVTLPNLMILLQVIIKPVLVLVKLCAILHNYLLSNIKILQICKCWVGRSWTLQSSDHYNRFSKTPIL